MGVWLVGCSTAKVDKDHYVTRNGILSYTLTDTIANKVVSIDTLYIDSVYITETLDDLYNVDLTSTNDSDRIVTFRELIKYIKCCDTCK